MSHEAAIGFYQSFIAYEIAMNVCLILLSRLDKKIMLQEQTMEHNIIAGLNGNTDWSRFAGASIGVFRSFATKFNRRVFGGTALDLALKIKTHLEAPLSPNLSSTLLLQQLIETLKTALSSRRSELRFQATQWKRIQIKTVYVADLEAKAKILLNIPDHPVHKALQIIKGSACLMTSKRQNVIVK